MMPHVLVVSHEASRTGAPRVAVEVLRAFGDLGWRTTVVHRWGGPMREEMDAIATTGRSEPASRLRATLRRSARTKPAARVVERLAIRRTLRTVRPDLVFCNTLLSSLYVPAAVDAGIPTVLYSHESTAFGRSALDRSGTLGVVGSPLLTFAACSGAASDCLSDWAGVEGERITTVQPCVSIAAVTAASTPQPTEHPGRPIVMGCGSANDLKGADVFVAAARHSHEAGDDLAWWWVGANPEGLADPAVTFVGEVAVTAPWIGMADVFVLPSRHDSFPMVVLEAMALGRPVVASDIDGPREQLASTGRFVAVGDAAALAREVGGLVRDPGAASALGAAAAQRCAELWDTAAFRAKLAALADGALAR